jgi:hypothetical protein
MRQVVEQSVVSLVFSDVILLVINKIPPVNKVMSQVLYNGPLHTDGDVGPSHSRGLGSVKLVLERVGNVVEVEVAGIIHILPREYDLVQVGRVSIGDRMLVGIPAAKAEVEAAHEGDFVIN